MKFLRLAVIGLVVGAAATAPRAQTPALKLGFPLACRIGSTCEVQNYFDRDPGPGTRDYRCGHRTYDGHNGVDIRVSDMAAQRRGVNVLAAAAGRVARVRDGVADISIRAPGAPPIKGQECGNGIVIAHPGGWETQYCHLARGSLMVKVGEEVGAGQAIARVGLSGNTEFPHLHLGVRRGTTMLDPFGPAPGAGAACAPQASLWSPAAAAAMAYKQGAVLNAGFAAGPVTMEAIEGGAIAAPSTAAGALVAYVRAIGLQQGDMLELTVTGPDGKVLATRLEPALPRDRAQQFLAAGRRSPATGWPPGTYRADFRVRRDGSVVLPRSFLVKIQLRNVR